MLSQVLSCRCYKNAFWFVTLLYPRCAQTSMQMFATQTLDVGTYLKADFSIRTRTITGSISPTYAGYLVLGTILVILFTVVIPLFYFLVIWKLRYRLQASDLPQSRVCIKVDLIWDAPQEDRRCQILVKKNASS